MKILALEIENSNANPSLFQKFAKAEAEHVYKLYQLGKIREIYYRQDPKAAVIMLECQDMDEARLILRELPFVRNNLITFEIIPLKPYNGFERLFNN
ncbi:MAG: superoxide dismutase [Candidatus Marinimicrobia bacterium]|nr:superoxide dismutase [Candidatus Neomarinimicrobiota bacterium]